MYTPKIIGVDTAFYQASNSYFVEVEVEIYKEEELVAVRKYGYPVGTTKEQIVSELDKVCETFGSDEEVATRSAELEATLAQAEALKNELLPVEEDVNEKI
jgi:hypothetical protein